MYVLTESDYGDLVETLGHLVFDPLSDDGEIRQTSNHLADLAGSDSYPDLEDARTRLNERVVDEIKAFDWSAYGADGLSTFRRLPGHVHGSIVEYASGARTTGDQKYAGEIDANGRHAQFRLADEAFALLADDVRNEAVGRLKSAAGLDKPEA